MSKQEKLAALIEAVETYCLKCTGKNAWGVEIKAAYDDWRHTPVDPPPRPEMPECVRGLLDYITEIYSCHCKSHQMAKAVRDHYAQPLKLEVGKCYADANGEVGKVFWFDKSKSLFHAVMLETGIQRHCHADGRSQYQSHPDFVREVKND